MTRLPNKMLSTTKEVRTWGVRRKEVDINQLALAYYLLARMRIEEQRRVAAADAQTSANDKRAA